MNNRYLIARLCVLSVCLAGLLPGAHALERATTADGLAYASGGVGQTDRMEMQEEKNRYSLWLTAATRGTGAYLAAVQVR